MYDYCREWKSKGLLRLKQTENLSAKYKIYRRGKYKGEGLKCKGSYREYLMNSMRFFRNFIIFCDFDNKKAMVEVIHRFYNSYPFGLEKETQNTFTLILKENLTEKEISLYRQKNKIFKEITGNSFIKLHRMLKEDNKLHLLYEYYPLSLDKFIESTKNQTKSPKEKCRALTNDFVAGIDCIIEQLVKVEIKADIFLWNLAAIPKDKDSMQLKVFIEPQAEFLTLIEHHYRPKEAKRRDHSTINQEFLQQFYQAERKRLNIEFQQLLEHHFGKFQEPEKKHMPNFVINGTKLLFINNDKEESQNTKNSKIQQTKSRENKEKIEQKVEQSSKKEQQLKTNLPLPALKGKQESEGEKQKKKIEKIVNFDQSFEPQFKPEQFTNENTYILEENDYLQSLEEELVKLASEKKLPTNTQNKFNKTQPNEKSKQESTNEEKRITESQKSIDNAKEAPRQSNPQNSSNSINQNQSNSNVSSQENEGQCLEICKIQPKETAIIEEKVFKYKMKIITSHEIEIEGDGQPNVEQIQREIMEGIKSGKLNINDLATNKKASQNRSTEMNNSNNSNESSKEVLSGSTHTQKSAPTANFLKDNGGKIVQSNHEGSKRESNLNNSPQVLETRSSDLQQAKLRSINQIIEKIGIRSNQQHHQNSQNNQQAKQSKVSSQQPQEQYKTGNINVAPTPHYKTEKIEMGEEKMEKADNYLTKIREAKEKAQHILRQYTKRKQ